MLLQRRTVQETANMHQEIPRKKGIRETKNCNLHEKAGILLFKIFFPFRSDNGA